MKILIISAHPNLEKSFASKTILEANQLLGENQIDVLQLDGLFKDLNNVDFKEQREMITDYDKLVVLSPMHWSNPSHVSKWYFDNLLTMGYAYGKGGDKLKNKQFQLVLTSGQPKDSYSTKGVKGKDVEAFLNNYIDTANFCQMKWVKPILIENIFGYTKETLLVKAKEVLSQITK